MAESSIPVDLLNPGQVFACLGFLEAADILAGNAEGGFDWTDDVDSRFRIHVRGNCNPFSAVLDFLATAKICRYAPPGYEDPRPQAGPSIVVNNTRDAEPAVDALLLSQTFPAPTADATALPIRLESCFGKLARIDLSHWADASSRNSFKLYSGNRSAADIADAMLHGVRAKPKKGQSEGDVRTFGLSGLWAEHGAKLAKDPFGILTPMGGSFNFDPRGGWTGLDAGYSPNEHKHRLFASPVVEVLAAIGLEHARPDEYEKRKVRYAVWGCLLPAMLARPALAGISMPIPRRIFSFDLALSGKNKIVTFAQEEAQL